MQILSPADFLAKTATIPIIDVRSPKEFLQGHIPSAQNMPLFSDEERATVGTLYKQQGKEIAFLKGLDFVGAKLSHFVKKAYQLAPPKKLLIHCWRGGMRSQSVAMLLQSAGFEVSILQGGYKAYRQYVLQAFQQDYKLKIVGGKTGTGKTEILQHLAKMGEQVIDLEAIACHKGSAFGHLLQKPQPTVEQFENDLFAVFQQQDLQKRIWVESESRSIGRVFIPEGFWQKMEDAPYFLVEIPEKYRLQRLIEAYSSAEKAEILFALAKISKKLGGLAYQKALQAFEENDLATATQIVLHYYDKSYTFSRQKRKVETIIVIEMQENQPDIAAKKLVEWGK